METVIIQASNPNELKVQLDALILTGATINLMIESSVKSFYVVVYTP